MFYEKNNFSDYPVPQEGSAGDRSPQETMKVLDIYEIDILSWSVNSFIFY